MSLNVNLDSSTTITKQAAVTETVSAFTINRIIDLPNMKKVKVKLSCCEEILEIPSLSDSNYGSDWTYTTVSAAAKAMVAAM
jgi:hypothetical protein|tara:strand:+ start:656 stop:901 length:246 start_codon:yes stop_codon:yes gene_type:complete